MNNKLYKSIIYDISKTIKNVINESLFDLDNDDIFNDDEDVVSDMIIKTTFDKTNSLCMKTLCQSGDYHNVNPDKEDGIPYILLDPDNELKYYIAPYRNYKSCGFGPRKRKNYDLQYFYRYILEFNREGTFDLHIAKFGNKPNFVINTQLYEFLCESLYKINKFIFFNPDMSSSMYDTPFETIFIISGERYGLNKNLTDKFVNNFPDIILPGGNKEKKIPAITLDKKWFSSDEYFIKFIDKLVKNGFTVQDTNKFIYSYDNIEEMKNNILSGKQELNILKQNKDKIDFLINELGQDYIDKYNQIISYLLTNGKRNVYLKTINTFRTEKICLSSTVINLRKDNNLYQENYKMVLDEDGHALNINNIEVLINKQILWKMFYIMNTEKLNSYKCEYTYGDCLDGVEKEIFTYRASFTIVSLDLNDLPLKLVDTNSLYTLYYVIGKAIAESDNIYDMNENSKYMYSPSKAEVESLNCNLLFDIHSFNYTYFTNQLKDIIDKTYKKYGLNKK